MNPVHNIPQQHKFHLPLFSWDVFLPLQYSLILLPHTLPASPHGEGDTSMALSHLQSPPAAVHILYWFERLEAAEKCWLMGLASAPWKRRPLNCTVAPFSESVILAFPPLLSHWFSWNAQDSCLLLTWLKLSAKLKWRRERKGLWYKQTSKSTVL